MPKEEKKDDDFLGKVLNLARRGEGGEKENAIRLVKKICKERNLNFDDVMSSTDKKEYFIDCKIGESDLLARIIYRYALLAMKDSIGQNRNATRLFFTTTPDRFVETCNAFSILRIQFKKEKAIFQDAFLTAFQAKHELFYSPTPEEWKKILKEKDEKPESEREKKRKKAAAHMAHAMDDVQILKQLTN